MEFCVRHYQDAELVITREYVSITAVQPGWISLIFNIVYILMTSISYV